jgi:ubiquinol-cytochrome c reductase cytochrome b subunit
MIPYYGIKDGFSVAISVLILLYFVVLAPDKLGHFDNFVLANPLITPVHIVPE